MRPDDLDEFEKMHDATIPHVLWKVELAFDQVLTADAAEGLSATLEPFAVSVFLHNQEATDGDNWRVSLTTYGTPDLAAMKAALKDAGYALNDNQIQAERLPETDWLRHVHDNFPPLSIGQFFIYGSHFNGDIPTHLTPLKIDAATAFGSGEHETTRGCIETLEDLANTGKTFKNALDMGCGSGILAIAMAKLWPDLKCLCVDIDPESATVTERHAAMNGVEKRLMVRAGNGYAEPMVDAKAPFDIIAANILAGPLIDMAADMADVLKPGGYAVLSGLLARQEKEVIAAQEKHGMELLSVRAINDWRALLLQKNRA